MPFVVVQVSPLWVLSNDIHANLEAPLEGVRAELDSTCPMGQPRPDMPVVPSPN